MMSRVTRHRRQIWINRHLKLSRICSLAKLGRRRSSHRTTQKSTRQMVHLERHNLWQKKWRRKVRKLSSIYRTFRRQWAIISILFKDSLRKRAQRWRSCKRRWNWRDTLLWTTIQRSCEFTRIIVRVVSTRCLSIAKSVRYICKFQHSIRKCPFKNVGPLNSLLWPPRGCSISTPLRWTKGIYGFIRLRGSSRGTIILETSNTLPLRSSRRMTRLRSLAAKSWNSSMILKKKLRKRSKHQKKTKIKNSKQRRTKIQSSQQRRVRIQSSQQRRQTIQNRLLLRKWTWNWIK